MNGAPLRTAPESWIRSASTDCSAIAASRPTRLAGGTVPAGGRGAAPSAESCRCRGGPGPGGLADVRTRIHGMNSFTSILAIALQRVRPSACGSHFKTCTAVGPPPSAHAAMAHRHRRTAGCRFCASSRSCSAVSMKAPTHACRAEGVTVSRACSEGVPAQRTHAVFNTAKASSAISDTSDTPDRAAAARSSARVTNCSQRPTSTGRSVPAVRWGSWLETRFRIVSRACGDKADCPMPSTSEVSGALLTWWPMRSSHGARSSVSSAWRGCTSRPAVAPWCSGKSNDSMSWLPPCPSTLIHQIASLLPESTMKRLSGAASVSSRNRCLS